MTNFIPTKKTIAGILSAAVVAVTITPPASAFAHDRHNSSIHLGHGKHLGKSGHRNFHHKYGHGYHGTKNYRRIHGRLSGYGRGYRNPGYKYRQPIHPGHRHAPIKQYKKKHSGKGDLVAAGIIGLAIGAVIAGSAAKRNNHSSYNQPYTGSSGGSGGSHIPLNDYRSSAPSQPQVITFNDPATLQPWTPGWYEWCDNRYRSFNRNTGTFRGYDGLDHFCVPK